VFILIGKLKHKFIVTCFAMGMLLISYTRVSADETKENKNPVDIEADSMDYDNSLDKYHAQGKVVIHYSGGVLNADDVELDNKNNIATARGNVLLKMGEDTLQGDKIVFNIENKTGVAYKGRAFYAKNHFYIKGDKIEKTGEQTYFIQQPRATTCDGDYPDWEIAGSEMDVTIEGYGLMENARLVTKGLPVFYSPFVPFPAKTKRQSGFLLPYLSYSREQDGLDIEIPFFWAISPQMDATLYQRYIEKRGFKEGAEFRYYLGSHSSGTFYGDYIEDTKHVIDTADAATSRDWQEMHQRWSYYLNHQTNFDPQFYVRTDLRKVSDKWYFRDFSAHNYYLDNYALTEEDPFKKVPFYGDQSLRSLESTVRVYKGWSNYSLTGLISSTDDFAVANNDLTLQKYPEIVFTGIKQSLLKTPVYYEFTGLYDYYYRGEGSTGHFFDLSPTFSLPFNISSYAKIIPQVAFKETVWMRDDSQAQGDNKNGDRTLYTASLDISSRLSRIFDLKVQNWEKIRHEIKPEITYFYTPNVRQDNIPDYMLAIAEQNGVIWALTNTFMAKIRDDAGAYSYLEVLRLKLFQAYNINDATKGIEGITVPATAERRPFSDLGIEFDFNPHKYFSFMARNQYSLYDGWTQMNYDLNVKDWRGDMLTVGYRYTLDSIEEIDINLKAEITNNITGNFVSRHDMFNSRTVENTVGLIYHSQCWSLGLDYTRTDTDSRFLLKISLAGLGTL
jgi:LPS-assembly protein